MCGAGAPARSELPSPVGKGSGLEVVISRLGLLAFKIVETQGQADQQNKRRDFWSFSKSDAGGLVVWYVIAFLICRFDMSKYKHHAFEHPMPTAKAAWVAIPLALLFAVLVKIRNR
jgi:hypothetical protein